MTVKKKIGYFQSYSSIFQRQVQIFRDHPQDLCAILQSLRSPKALPLGISFLCSI